jgi:hypothetical protein
MDAVDLALATQMPDPRVTVRVAVMTAMLGSFIRLAFTRFSDMMATLRIRPPLRAGSPE